MTGASGADGFGEAADRQSGDLKSPPCVLVVDDEASILDAVATALRYEGFRVVEASSGRAGLTAAQQERPDLVVLDVMLPDLDGFAIARRLRADGLTMPVLFLTAVDRISDEELWAARRAARAHLVDRSRVRATQDRLRRGEDLGYVEAAQSGFDPDRLTIGFARRLATYKRLYLLSLRPERALRLLGGEQPAQFIFAGKAHPLDDEAKQIVRNLFQLKGSPEVAPRVAFLEDYDLSFAAELVAGCDVWVNVPRPPEEASGTSGMKAALNGSLNLSVLDGWWAEAYDGTNGWAIDGDTDPDHHAQDARHADALFDLLEQQVTPMFHERDEAGIPRRWLSMVRASLRTNGPLFSATRMVREYATRIYPM